MTPQERELIKRVANRIQKGRNTKKDPQAEQFIQKVISRKANAHYLLTQTVIIQDLALHRARKQIAMLEEQLRQAESKPGEGGFFSGLFGGSKSDTSNQSVTPIPPEYTHGNKQAVGKGAKGSGNFSDFLWSAASVATGITAGNYLVNTVNDYLGEAEGAVGSSLAGEGGTFLDQGETVGSPAEEDYFSEAESSEFAADDGYYETTSVEPTGDDDFYQEEIPESSEELVAKERSGGSCEVEEEGGFIDDIGENLWS